MSEVEEETSATTVEVESEKSSGASTKEQFAVLAESDLNPNPPASTVRFVFIHHSTG